MKNRQKETLEGVFEFLQREGLITLDEKIQAKKFMRGNLMGERRQIDDASA
ncbi:MAG: hypothetical protein PHV18_13400 [Lachnospiraceae bacterium]|nr:hypothetical protein [Lachnospiraceae bacterium]